MKRKEMIEALRKLSVATCGAPDGFDDWCDCVLEGLQNHWTDEEFDRDMRLAAPPNPAALEAITNNALKSIQSRLPLFDLELEVLREIILTAIEDAAAIQTAAPDLLAALEELDALVRRESPALLEEDSGGDARVARKIEDAIAKAKKGQP